MPKTTERTSFTKDVQGRHRCNDITEVNAWQTSGGRPFDIIVVGEERSVQLSPNIYGSGRNRTVAACERWLSTRDF